MDLRTKLVFALVAVSLGSMLALGAVAYSEAGQLLKQSSLRQLNALAETKRDDLDNVIEGWEERVRLIASRTQLRLSLQAYSETGDPLELEQIQRIITDAQESAETVHRLAVYDVERRRVATSAVDGMGESERLDAERWPRAGAAVFEGVFMDPELGLEAGFMAPLELAGGVIGAIHIVLSAAELVELTTDSTGLGETGETLIVLDEEGGARMLNPLRHRPAEPAALVPLEASDRLARLALRAEEGVYSEGLTDYRGERVWAATRRLPEVGWGLVVKFDAAEEREPIVELRRRLTRLGLSLSAFAILLGILLGLRLAKPIHDLAEVADRIRLGDLTARAKARRKREDEIGLLARTFNEMAEELERRMSGSGRGPRAPSGDDGGRSGS